MSLPNLIEKITKVKNLNKEILPSLNTMTKNELIELSKKLKVRGISKLNKKDLIKNLIEEKSVAELKSIISPSLWRKHRNSIFGWASVIGLLIALFGLLPIEQKKIKDESNQNNILLNQINIDTKKFKNLVFTSAHELRKNKEYIFELNWHLKNTKYPKPIGELKFVETRKLFNSHFPKILKFSFGEEKYLFQMILKLERSNTLINNIKNKKDFINFNKNYDMTVDDITFLSGFLFWYVSIMAQEELTQDMNHTLGWSKNEDDFNSKIDTSNLHMKYMDYPDHGYITSYSDYLSLID